MLKNYAIYKDKFSYGVVYSCLNKGTYLGLCEYYGNRNPLIIYDIEYTFVHEFKSKSELLRESKNILGVSMTEKGMLKAINDKTLYKDFYIVEK